MDCHYTENNCMCSLHARRSQEHGVTHFWCNYPFYNQQIKHVWRNEAEEHLACFASLYAANVLQMSLYCLSDESEAVDSMYDTEPNLVTGESAEEETEDSIMSPIAVGPSSPQPCNEDFTPKEGSPYEVPVYIPDDIPIPADLELRESSVPGAGLGIWAKVKICMGEFFGPYNGLQSAMVKETTYGWEVRGDEMACVLHVAFY